MAISASIASAISTPVSNGAANGPTSPINTTGANFLIVVAQGAFGALGTATPTDSKLNTWTRVLGPTSPNSSDSATVVWVSFNPTVGALHTFTIPQTVTYTTMIVDARSGVNSGSVTASNYQSTVGGTTLTWSLTPTDNGSLLYLAVGVITTAANPTGGGFSTWDIQGTAGVSGVNYGGYLASQVQGSATLSNPTVTSSGADYGGYLLSFKPAGGGSILTSAGTSSAAFVGSAIFSSVLTAPGTSSATFTGSSLSSSAFSANGSSVATFNGSPLFLSVLTAAGSSTGSFVGSSLFSSALTANGASSVNFIGAPISLSILTAVATSSASFISGGAGAAAFTVGGSATASFVGATRTSGVFMAAGLSSAIFTSPAATFAAFSASGSSSLSWSGSSSVIVNTTGTRFYDRNLAYSYPPGAQKSQILSYDPVNDTLVVTTISGDVFGWYARGISPTIAIAIANAPDKRIFINTILGFPPVTVVFID